MTNKNLFEGKFFFHSEFVFMSTFGSYKNLDLIG